MLGKYRDATGRMRQQAADLQELAVDPEEHRSADKIAIIANQGIMFGDRIVEHMKGKDIGPESLARLDLLQFSGSLLKEIHVLADVEQKRSDEQSRSEHQKRQIIWDLLIAGLIFNFALALSLARYFNAATTSRLTTVVDNSLRLAAGKELNPQLKGRDEIAQLDKVFHQMAQALVEAQKKERAIVENALDVICSVRENMAFAAVSPASKAVFGYEPEDLIGKRITEIVPSDEAQTLSKMFAQVKAGEAGPSVESRVKRTDDALVDVRWSVHWSEEEQSFFCVARDITAERQIERLKQEFVSMISHDLRTPLMSVQASLFLLSAGASGNLPDGAAKNVADAERNVSYIIGLINSLIDIERLATDKLELNCAPTDLCEIIDTAAQAVQAIADTRKIKIECVFTDAEVYADSGRMIQVMINLLSNALKFSGEGTTIKVDIKELEKEVEVQVIDQGRGIPASHLDKVFSRFEQVEESDSKEKGGAGLGLAICKAIVEAHGGSIGVDSEPGKGSKFWFRLPHHAAVPAS
jgi:PAS domain S-box-containing protein